MARKTRKAGTDEPEEDRIASEQELDQDAAAGSADTAAKRASADAPPADPASERDEYLARWQRAQADYRNLRRRTLADIDSAVRRSTRPVLEALLTAVDHLEMALGSPCESDEARNLAVGVSMTRDELIKTLEVHGVKPIPEGGLFDPELHQAVATVPSVDLEAGQIAATLRTGYAWGEEILRHAQVHVVADAEQEDGGPDFRGDGREGDPEPGPVAAGDS